MYEAFYNLSEKPFRLSPDPGFLYGSESHARAMAYLRYGLDLGEGFVVITGEVGAGKTTLACVLLEELRQETVVATSLASTQVESEDLLRVVAGSFGIDTAGVPKGLLLVQLQDFFSRNLEEGKRTVLIVDEAQNLPWSGLEELRMLSNLVSGTRPLLQSLLLGQKEFLAMLKQENMEQIRQRIVAAHHLSPLQESEVQPYVEHRLRLVGWKRDPSFTSAAYVEIARNTRGLPRQVNLLCERILMYCYVEELHEVNAEIVRIAQREREAELDDNAPASAGDAQHAATPVAEANSTPPVGSVVTDAERRLAALEKKLDQLEEKHKLSSQKVQKLLMMMLMSDENVDSAEAVRKLDKLNAIL